MIKSLQCVSLFNKKIFLRYPLMLTMVIVIFFISFSIKAQQNLDVWTDISESSIKNRGSRLIIPGFYRTLSLNKVNLIEILNQVPLEFSANSKERRIYLNIPYPNGELKKFYILDSPIMEPELAAKYPEIRTFIAQGVDDPFASGRLDLTPHGFHAMILSPKGMVFVDPYSKESSDFYFSYYKKDYSPNEIVQSWECEVLDTESEVVNEIRNLVSSGSVDYSGEALRTYRLAVAATAEYTAFHGGTVASGQAAIVTAMNRVNGVYEREVAIRMILVANNNLLVYTNAATDPYTNSDGFSMLGQNQTNIDAVIGDANYDIGHVFSTGGGGVANFGVPCRTGLKARGVTGLPTPTGDPFFIDYVTHEMGHQWAGNHTFNGSSGSCAGGNRNDATAYEPGSGSTILAYAGICSPQNLQPNSDAYFHGISLDEIIAYSTLSFGNSCAVMTATGNNAPIVNAGPGGYTVPISTPFTLTGSVVFLQNLKTLDGLFFDLIRENFQLQTANH